MDSKIMGLIDAEVTRLPAKGNGDGLVLKARDAYRRETTCSPFSRCSKSISMFISILG